MQALKLLQSYRRIFTKNLIVFVFASGFIILGYRMLALNQAPRVTYVQKHSEVKPGPGLEHDLDTNLESGYFDDEEGGENNGGKVAEVEDEEEDSEEDRSAYYYGGSDGAGSNANEDQQTENLLEGDEPEEEEPVPQISEDQLIENSPEDENRDEKNPVQGNTPVVKPKTRSKVSNKPEPKYKTILFWTKYYKDPYFGIRGLGHEPFLQNHCKVHTCNATNDISRVEEADAIVMHMRDPMYPFPHRRGPDQLFVFFLHEAPPASFYNQHFSLRPAHAAAFNVTMSYRRDSDIPMFYCGDIRSHKRPHTYELKTWANKTRNVVWMSSHCRTDSKRERYISALSKYIDVDVYGRCGDKVCPKSEGTKCEENFQYTYKFFVSAENAICLDYVSEKLGRGLSYEMIPIVYGGVNYTEALPPRSVIDITEYESPEHLAKHLRHLSENQSEYLKYFEWKGKYGRKRVTKTMAMCDLCAKLHDPTYHKTYDDIVKWWKQDTCSTDFIQNQINKGYV